jgi:hypothetical protein
MRKAIISIMMIGWLLTSSIVSVNAVTNQNQQQQEEDFVEVLWSHPADGKRIFSSYITEDNTPDIITGSYAFNGLNGGIIYQLAAGKVLYVGDINNDNKDEIISYTDDVSPTYITTIYCLDFLNNILWSKTFDSAWVFHASIGDILGDSKKEVILCLGDANYRNNHYIYCLDGLTGTVNWRKWTDGYPLCCEVSDVNNDEENEVIVSTDGTTNSAERIGYIYCLNAYGYEIWNLSEYNGYFRHFCISNLNDDGYKEIIAEKEYGIRCISGLNGSILWSFDPMPLGSFQSIRTGDLISEIPGKEVIIGGISGIFCLKGADSVTDREIWRYSGGSFPNNFIASIAIGDIDKDGLLDVAGITFSYYAANGYVITVNGQDGTPIWKYEDCGAGSYKSCIICQDLTGEGFPEVIAKDTYYVVALGTGINCPPIPPTINGPSGGNAGTEYTYSFASADSDNDDIDSYTIDWGDDIMEVVEGPFDSGEIITVNHTWTEKGTYTIKAKAKDIFDLEGDWGTLSVTMPLNLQGSQQSSPTPQTQPSSQPSSQQASLKINQLLQTTTKTTAK